MHAVWPVVLSRALSVLQLSAGVAFFGSYKFRYFTLACQCFHGIMTLAMQSKTIATQIAQLDCVRTVRNYMNIKPLQKGVDRRRDARSQQVAKLITYGQVDDCYSLLYLMFTYLYAIEFYM